MNLAPLYDFYQGLFSGYGFVANLLLLWLFLYAHRQHRAQRSFLVFAFGSLCFAFTAGYHFASHLQRHFSVEIFSLSVWRFLAYLYFVAEPLAFLAYVLGPIVLVFTYGGKVAPIRRTAQVQKESAAHV